MTSRTVTAAAVLVLGAMICPCIGSQPAQACNKTAGCAMDTLEESHDMMRDGRMSEAMAAGRANVEAFRRLREAEESMATWPARRTVAAPR